MINGRCEQTPRVMLSLLFHMWTRHGEHDLSKLFRVALSGPEQPPTTVVAQRSRFNVRHAKGTTGQH